MLPLFTVENPVGQSVGLAEPLTVLKVPIGTSIQVLLSDGSGYKPAGQSAEITHNNRFVFTKTYWAPIE